jgi:hypothetical protein
MTKSTKTKDELRSLILSEIAGHPVCPPGMDVSIRAIEGGTWSVDAIPPGRIAHADCVDYIGQITRRLREEYDLSEERAPPDHPLSQPSTGWMNPPDISDQIVGQIANHRARFVAATSAGQPERNAPASSGAAPDFSNAIERERWLEVQTTDAVALFAARAALRVVPALTLASGAGRSRSGLADVRELPPVRAAVYAAAAAATPEERKVPSFASAVIDYVLDAAGSKGRLAFEVTLNALRTDAGLLGQGFSPVTLAMSQLWPEHIPDWVGENWAELKSALLAAAEDWEVWTEWYEQRLAGQPTTQFHEMARVTIPGETWDRGPKIANAQIKSITNESKQPQRAPTDLPAVEAIPQQVEMGSQFTQDAEGRIDLAPDPLSQAPLADGELYREVRHKAAALSALGHNQLADLFGPIERFLAAAPERIEDVSVTRIWSRGNTLRLRLKAHETASVSADRMDPALIPTVAAEMLQDLVETYNVFIFRDPTGRELDQVRFGPGERSEAEATVHLAFSVVQAVQATPGLATAAAVETLTEQVEAARNAPTGIHGDQAIALSRKTSGNFIIAVLNAAYILFRNW